MQKKIDLLTHPHKDQRKWMYSLSIEASQLDFKDKNQINCFDTELKALVDDLKDHAENEEMFILPLIANRFPDAAGIFQHDHPGIKKQLQELLETWQDVIQAPNKDRTDRHLNFYRIFNRFIGEYLLHLDEEERKILPVLDVHFSAEELIGVMFAYKTYREGHEPKKVREYIHSMLQPLTIRAMVSLYASIKKHTSQTLFLKVCDLSEAVIEPTQWAQIEKQI